MNVHHSPCLEQITCDLMKLYSAYFQTYDKKLKASESSTPIMILNVIIVINLYLILFLLPVYRVRVISF